MASVTARSFGRRADALSRRPAILLESLLWFSNLLWCFGDNVTLGGFIQVGVASSPHGGRVSLVCGRRCLIASCSLIPWHWLFKLGMKDLEGRLSNINKDMRQTDLKCSVTNCNGIFHNLVGQVNLFYKKRKCWFFFYFNRHFVWLHRCYSPQGVSGINAEAA